ncbi:MAG: FCD domain-containing protein [Clostridia bacterium]
MEFEKIENTSIKDKALIALEEKILSGIFATGDKLPTEREIAKEMGISRGIISMCILELETKGFVKIVPRKGTYVMDFLKKGTPDILFALMNYDNSTMDYSLFQNMMDMRKLIEYECVSLAIKNCTNQDLEELDYNIKQMENHLDDEKFCNYDFNFHHALVASSGNSLYAMTVKAFEKSIIFFIKQGFTSKKAKQESIKIHKELINNIKSKDKENAIKTIKVIFESGIDELSKKYKK